jgi:hypothetical protein
LVAKSRRDLVWALVVVVVGLASLSFLQGSLSALVLSPRCLWQVSCYSQSFRSLGRRHYSHAPRQADAAGGSFPQAYQDGSHRDCWVSAGEQVAVVSVLCTLFPSTSLGRTSENQTNMPPRIENPSRKQLPALKRTNAQVACVHI